MIQYQDHLTSFLISQASIRGRIIRLGEEIRKSLERHQYPELINNYLSQMVCIASCLAIDLKHAGTWTLQITNGDIIRMLVVDITVQGQFRVCAKFDSERLAAITKHTWPSMQEVFGTATMMFSADIAHHSERYQAIVELSGNNFSDSIHHYFRASDQIPTTILIHTDLTSREFCAGAVLLQQLPSANENQEEAADKWHTNICLLATLKKEELLNPKITSSTILHRLFHNQQLEVFSTITLQEKCSCSKERLKEIIEQFPPKEIQNMIQDQHIQAKCEFCNQLYIFDEKEIKKISSC